LLFFTLPHPAITGAKAALPGTRMGPFVRGKGVSSCRKWAGGIAATSRPRILSTVHGGQRACEDKSLYDLALNI